MWNKNILTGVSTPRPNACSCLLVLKAFQNQPILNQAYQLPFKNCLFMQTFLITSGASNNHLPESRHLGLSLNPSFPNRNDFFLKKNLTNKLIIAVISTFWAALKHAHISSVSLFLFSLPCCHLWLGLVAGSWWISLHLSRAAPVTLLTGMSGFHFPFLILFHAFPSFQRIKSNFHSWLPQTSTSHFPQGHHLNLPISLCFSVCSECLSVSWRETVCLSSLTSWSSMGCCFFWEHAPASTVGWFPWQFLFNCQVVLKALAPALLLWH